MRGFKIERRGGCVCIGTGCTGLCLWSRRYSVVHTQGGGVHDTRPVLCVLP
jgi:hypothetical protein